MDRIVGSGALQVYVQPQEALVNATYHQPTSKTRSPDCSTGLRPLMSNTELIPSSNAVQLSHAGAAERRYSRQCSDVSCHERLGDAGAKSCSVDEVFYVERHSAASRTPTDEPQTTNTVGGRAFVCTTGTNLYRILALSDKLSTVQAGDDRRQQVETFDGGDVKLSTTTTEDITLSRYNQHSADSIADDTFPPPCMTDVCQHVDEDKKLNSEVLKAAEQRPAAPPSRPPPTWQLRRHCSTVDEGSPRRQRPHSMSQSYRSYSSHVFSGAPKLASYGNDVGASTTSGMNWLPVGQTTSTSDSRHSTARCSSTSSPTSSANAVTQSLPSTSTENGDDEPTPLVPVRCIGQIPLCRLPRDVRDKSATNP